MSVAEILDRDHDPVAVEQVWRLVAWAEHQRRQLPPGVRISGQGFGTGHRLPVVNGFTSIL